MVHCAAKQGMVFEKTEVIMLVTWLMGGEVMACQCEMGSNGERWHVVLASDGHMVLAPVRVRFFCNEWLVWGSAPQARARKKKMI